MAILPPAPPTLPLRFPAPSASPFGDAPPWKQRHPSTTTAAAPDILSRLQAIEGVVEDLRKARPYGFHLDVPAATGNQPGVATYSFIPFEAARLHGLGTTPTGFPRIAIARATVGRVMLIEGEPVPVEGERHVEALRVLGGPLGDRMVLYPCVGLEITFVNPYVHSVEVVGCIFAEPIPAPPPDRQPFAANR